MGLSFQTTKNDKKQDVDNVVVGAFVEPKFTAEQATEVTADIPVVSVLSDSVMTAKDRSRAVARYLESLDKGRTEERNAKNVANIEKYKAKFSSSVGLTRAEAATRLMRAEKALGESALQQDSLESNFVLYGREVARRRHLSADGLLMMGVPTSVLLKAGITV